MKELRETPRLKAVPLGVLVRPDQRRQLAEFARRDDRSVSSVTRAAIDAYLERERERRDA
jgi:predicted transcriptional regulator